MKRKLFRRISNEWKSNIWLALELLIVSVVLWFVVDSMYTFYAILNEPRGFDTEHCYLIQFAELSDRSPDYKEYATREEKSDDFLRLFDRLAARPEVVAVGVGQNSYIYNGSNGGTALTIDSISTTGWVLRRVVSPEFPIIFRVHGSNGETPEQLAEILRTKPLALLCSENVFREYGKTNMDEYIGRDFFEYNFGDTIPLSATYKTVRYGDYFPAVASRSIMRSVPREHYCGMMNEMFLRVKDNMDHDFIENPMKDAAKDLRFGNFYIANVKSFDDIRNRFQLNSENGKRNLYTIILFLAVNIFLGLLGTFVPYTDPGSRDCHTHGKRSYRGDIFRRFIGEGELLLLLIMPIAIAIEWALTFFGYNDYYNGFFSPGRFAICVLISYALMAFMIFLGTVIPAYRAMKLQPAAALKEE